MSPFEKLSSRLIEALEEKLTPMTDNLKNDLRLAVKKVLSEFNIPNTEAFNAQVSELQQAQEKLKELEGKLDMLENESTGTLTSKNSKKTDS